MIAPFSATTALAAGFVAVPRTVKSFTHPRYPGLLFRLVDSTDEAVSVGGILCSNDDGAVQVLSFGLTAVWALGKGMEGSIFSPSSFKRILDSSGPKRVIRNRIVSTNVYPPVFIKRELISFESTQVLVGATKQRTMLIDYKYMGIVSQCDRGHIFVRQDGLWHEDIPTSVVSDTAGAIMPENDGVRVGMPVCGGFLNISWKVDRKSYLVKAKSGFLQSLPTGAVRDSYSGEFDKLIGAESGSVEDGLFLHAAYSGGVVSFTHQPVMDATLMSNYDPYVNGGVASALGYGLTKSYDGVDEFASFDSGPSDYSLKVLGNYSGTLSDGRPYVKHLLAQRELGSNYTSLYVPGVSPTVARVYSFVATFPIDRVPYEFIEMEKGIKLKAGNVLCVVSPLAAPTVPVVSEFTMDLTNRLDVDMLALGSSSLQTPLLLDNSVTQTQGALLIQAGRESEASRQLNVDKLLPMARPFTRFILSTVNKLDKAVSAR